MLTAISGLFAGASRRLTYAAALTIAALAFVWLLLHRDRNAAEAQFAIRRAEARIRALNTSREVHHDINQVPDAERRTRLARWMRD